MHFLTSLESVMFDFDLRDESIVVNTGEINHKNTLSYYVGVFVYMWNNNINIV